MHSTQRSLSLIRKATFRVAPLTSKETRDNAGMCFFLPLIRAFERVRNVRPCVYSHLGFSFLAVESKGLPQTGSGTSCLFPGLCRTDQAGAKCFLCRRLVLFSLRVVRCLRYERGMWRELLGLLQVGLLALKRLAFVCSYSGGASPAVWSGLARLSRCLDGVSCIDR